MSSDFFFLGHINHNKIGNERFKLIRAMVSVLVVDGTSKMALPRRVFLQFEVGITKTATFTLSVGKGMLSKDPWCDIWMASETEVLDFLSQSPYWTMASRFRKWGPPLHCINNLDVNISIFMELSHRVWQL